MTPARFPNGLERRAGAELRATRDGRRLEGYAAVFGTPARIGSFTETIRAGAFTRTLAAAGDVLALMDHDSSKVLARMGNGSLRLAEDGHGLAFALDLPDTTIGRDALSMVESRLAGGMSFGFHVQDEAWPAPGRRELRAVSLAEISVVSGHPAYGATSVVARARGPADAGLAARRRFLDTL